MKSREELEELISAYALGALDGDELKKAEEILASDSDAAKLLLSEFEEVTNSLSYASKGLMPGPEFRKKILSEILGSNGYPKAESAPTFWSRFWNIGLPLGAALAAGLVLVLFISNQSLNRKLHNEKIRIAELEVEISNQNDIITSLRTRIAKIDSERGDLEASYANLDEITEFLEDPDVYVIHLTNMHDNAEAGSGVLVDLDDDEALFYCLDLHDAPEDKTYQLWVKANGVNKSIAAFNVDDRGTHIVKLKSLSNLGHLERYSVTLESEGGAEKPSGKLIFAGDHRGSSL